MCCPHPRYVQLRLRSVAERQAGAERRLDALEAGGTPPTSPTATQRAHPGSGLIRRGPLQRLCRPGWLGRRAASCAALAVAMAASMASPAGHPVLKLAGLLPLVCLLPPDNKGGG